MNKRFLKKENGEVMVESSLVLSVAVIVVFLLLYLGLVMYHQTLITTTANITASNIAQVYSNKAKDPVTGYIDVSNLDNEGIIIKMKNEVYANEISKKAEWYSKYRMAKGQFLKSGEPEINVSIENKSNALMRAQVVVEVKESYEVPFIKLFGIKNPVIEYQAIGRADCFEMMDYVNVIEAADKIDVTENFLVTFHKKDGSVHKVVEVMHDMSIAQTMKLSAAEKTVFPADPTMPDEKWYRWRTGTGQTFTRDTIVTGNIDVYAEYDYKVYFNPNGGSVGESMRYVHPGARIGILPAASRANYACSGWFTAASGGTQYNADSRINASITLYAHWSCLHPSKRVEMQPGSNCKTGVRYKEYCNICGIPLNEYTIVGEHRMGHCFNYGERSHVFPNGRDMSGNRGKGNHWDEAYGKTYQTTLCGCCYVCSVCHYSNGYYCHQHLHTDGSKGICSGYYMQFPEVNYCPHNKQYK